jgi:G:T-mismatch repair DNA endonuclease (very short patch repair protein)
LPVRPPAQGNISYLGPKLRRNVERDIARRAELEALEYRVLVSGSAKRPTVKRSPEN